MKLEEAWVGDVHFSFLRAWVGGWGAILLAAGVASPFLGYALGITEHELQDVGGLGSALLFGVPGLLIHCPIGGGRARLGEGPG
ncbi:MAG TPA: hypothetical protein QGF58_07720 [Myxococcota bacterium]|nr:hypothetical protein [Myxococcota bacterium]